MKARALVASFLVCGMVTLGVLFATRGASAATNSTSVPFTLTCTSTGQECDASYQQTVTTTSVLTLEFESAWDGCATFSVTFLVDGVPVFTSAPLGPFVSTGPVDAGPVSAGNHLLEVRATGVAGGCDQGTLTSWGGRFTATTNDDPVAPTPAEPTPTGTPATPPPSSGGDGRTGADCKKAGWKSAVESLWKNQGKCVSDDARKHDGDKDSDRHDNDGHKDDRKPDRGRPSPNKSRH